MACSELSTRSWTSRRRSATTSRMVTATLGFLIRKGRKYIVSRISTPAGSGGAPRPRPGLAGQQGHPSEELARPEGGGLAAGMDGYRARQDDEQAAGDLVLQDDRGARREPPFSPDAVHAGPGR